MSKIIAVCTSEKKGMKKSPVAEVTVEDDYGVAGPKARARKDRVASEFWRARTMLRRPTIGLAEMSL